jgi:hypothetical protein
MASSQSDEVGALSSPVARNINATYENIEAECPECGNENIFNRMSDLQTRERIDGRDVVCQFPECGKTFKIMTDVINDAWDMMLFDCNELMRRKRYMNCIANVAQSYEVFLSTYLRVQLVYRPFERDITATVDRFNSLLDELYKVTKRHTFDCMHGLFQLCVVEGLSPKNLDDAELIINNLPESPNLLKKDRLKSLRDAELANTMLKLAAVDVNALRNRIVHKYAYRPTKEEAAAKLEEANQLLRWLKNYYKVHDRYF